MPCYHPLSAGKLPGGKILFGTGIGSFPAGTKPLSLPCGKCIGCRIEKSRQWAVRIMHEAELHEANCFITLTYNDENLPADSSLSVRALQLFWKRLRKRVAPVKFKFFAAGEYGDPARGEREWNPHYHACVFGYAFPDKFKTGRKNGFDLFESDTLAAAWPFGHHSIAELTFESAQYVAGYVTKKINGAKASEHYGKRIPEFGTMSRGGRQSGRGGIGADWFSRFSGDVYPADEVIVRGKSCKPPRYYDEGLKEQDPYLAELVALARDDSQAVASQAVAVRGCRGKVVHPSRNPYGLESREKKVKAEKKLYERKNK